MKRQNKFVRWLDRHTIDLVVWFFAAALLVAWGCEEVYGGAKCDQWEEGYRDGYCSTISTPYCTVPVPPTCIEASYRSERQAYMAGFSAGQRAR